MDILCFALGFSFLLILNTYAAGFVTNIKYYLITLLRNSEDEKSSYLIEIIELGGKFKRCTAVRLHMKTQ